MRRLTIVTGGAGGIGFAFARMLAAADQGVVMVDIDPSVQDRASTLGVEAVVADVREPHPVVTALGGRVLDGLVNCAGVATQTGAVDVDGTEFQRTIDVNLLGPLRLVRDLLPALRRSECPRVLNVTSIHARRAASDVLSYGVSKSALEQATRALAVELAPDGVLVNALAPGFVDTAMSQLPDGVFEHETEEFQRIYVTGRRLPLARPARPEEVAAAGEFLLSARNTYVTGAVLAVDGGLSATF